MKISNSSNSFGFLRTISTTVDFAKDFHWLFIGGAGAVTPLHIDPTTTHAWLTQISGRKRFTLWAPSDIPELLSEDQNRSNGRFGTDVCCVFYPIGSMYGIYANIWGLLMVNVTIYSIHGSYGYNKEIIRCRYRLYMAI